MTELIDRWGDRTLYRVEKDFDDSGGLELILRLRGVPRTVSREEITIFLEHAIQVLNGGGKKLKGAVRSVSSGNTAPQKIRTALTDSQREMVSSVLNGLHSRLNQKGRNELVKNLKELITKL